MKITEWWFYQTKFTRFGTYFIVIILVYLTARAMSIGFGWNSGWFN